MKSVLTLTLIAALAVAFNPQKAEAGDDGAKIIGGIIGGLIIGEILDDDRHSHSSVHVSYGHHHYGRHSHGGGYYRYETYRRWVPGGWVWRFDDCGVRYRHHFRGHYTYDKRRVWVPYHSRHHRDYGHYDRGHRRYKDYGRGHDRHRRDDRRDDRCDRNYRRDRR